MTEKRVFQLQQFAPVYKLPCNFRPMHGKTHQE